MVPKDVLISGAAGGIGWATVQRMLSLGLRVFALDNRAMPAHQYSPDRLVAIEVDIRDQEAIDQAALKVSSFTDGLDAIINNAGWFDQFPMTEVSTERFEQLLSINVLGAHRVVRAFFTLLHNRSGRVINVSSEAALVAMPLQVYGMTKMMLDSYAAVLRQELALIDMKMITVRPGAYLTPFIARSIDVLGEVDEASAFARALQHVKREGTKILQKVHRDPDQVATVMIKALTDRRPRREYWIGVSMRFRVLKLLPVRLRELILRYVLTR